MKFFRSKSSGTWCAGNPTGVGLICVNKEVDEKDLTKVLSSTTGVAVGDNILYGYDSTAVEVSVKEITAEKQNNASVTVKWI